MQLNYNFTSIIIYLIMNQSTQEQFKDININKFVNYIVLLAVFLNLYALELRKKNLINNVNSNKPKKIFITVLLLGVISNLIIFSRNLRELKMNSNNPLYKIRQLANALILIALICVIFFETQTNDNTDSPFI